MVRMNRQYREKARKELLELGREARELDAAIRSANGAMTRAQSARISELADKRFPALQARLGVLGLGEAQKLLGERLIVGADYRERIGLDLGTHGPLPLNIIEILNRPCPVVGAGKKVHETHLLAWVPADLTMKRLSAAVGGQAGKVLWSNWFENHASGYGDKAAGRGRWILIPERCPPKTLNKSWKDSRQVLKAEYPMYEQADALGFAAALIMYERKTAASKDQKGTRLYANQWGWCTDRIADPLWGAAGAALLVGNFYADGLDVDLDYPDFVDPSLGCAACWNFGTR